MAEITLETLPQAQQKAMARLHLKLTGDTHALLLDLLDKLRVKLAQAGDGDTGVIDPLAANTLTDFTAIAWREFFSAFERRFMAARREAALIAFAAVAAQHDYFFGFEKAESRPYRPHPLPLSHRERGERFSLLLEDAPQLGVVPEYFYEPQLKEVLDAAAERIYSDNFRLSQRIWNLDQEGLDGLRRIINEAIATGDSAWNTAKKLEAHLGMGQECPRWTSTRLYKLTKTDIAQGDTTGLIRGNPCASKGVAYNALRLARNETQIAHAMATDTILARLPWVQAEKVNLSPAHPPIECDCEAVANGGEKNDGVYPRGTISLPRHVQCLCFKTAVTMPPDDFVNKLRGWMNGSEKWSEMDTYASWTGNTAATIATSLAAGSVLYQQLMLPLERWLSDKEDDLNGALDA
jgi:hypothetical protein